MPDDFYESAIAEILRHEGGFCDDPNDPGGATNWGVSLRFLRSLGLKLGDIDGDGDIDADDIRKLTRDQAKALYRSEFWDRYNYGTMNLAVGMKVMDLCVNTGPVQAHKILQRSLRAAGGAVLVDDGILGPKTRKAVENAAPALVRVALRSEAAGFYRTLVTAKPRLNKYIGGWIVRSYW